MGPNESVLLAILLIISTPIKCQFEFNDMQVVRGIILDIIQIGQVKCVSVLRPNDQNVQQKSAIDGLTRQLVRKFNSETYHSRWATVMSYTTEQYEKFLLDENMQKRDNCIRWGVLVMVSDSTNAQLVQLSSNMFNFDYTHWILFTNGTDLTSLLANVRIRVSSKIWILRPLGNGLFRMTGMGTLGSEIGNVLWAKDGGLVAMSKKFTPNMIGTNVTVGTLQNGPYTRVKRNNNGGITSVSGFYGEIWNDLQEALMFNSVFIIPKHGGYGVVDANGNWTGLYGLLVRKEVDVILGAMTITETRNHIVDFLHAIQKTKYQIFYKREADINDWFKVFRPLAYTVWIALVIWIVVGGTIAYFVSLAVKNFQQVSSDMTLINCIYFVLRTLCIQGFDQVPKSWALRIFLITAYLHATLIVTSYSASLISVLTVKTPVEPFQALPDILNTDYKLTLNSNSTDYDFFAKTKSPVHQEIYEKLIKRSQGFGGYYNAITTACKNQKTVFFGTFAEVAVMYRYTKLPCVLLPLRSEVSPAYKTIATAKHSQYRETLNQGLFRMTEHGLVNRYRLLYMPHTYESSLKNEIGIGLIDVGAVFIYLITFEALSVAIFILELLSWKYQLHKTKQTTPQRGTAKPVQWIWLE